MVVVVVWIDGGCSGLVISVGWGEEALCGGGELWLLCLGCFGWCLFGLALHWLRLQILQLENAPLRTKGPSHCLLSGRRHYSRDMTLVSICGEDLEKCWRSVGFVGLMQLG